MDYRCKDQSRCTCEHICLKRNQKRNHGNAEHSYFEMVPWFNTETHNYIELIQGFVVVSVDYIIGLAHSPLPPDSKQTTNQSFKFPRKLQRWSNLNEETFTLSNWSLKHCVKAEESIWTWILQAGKRATSSNNRLKSVRKSSYTFLCFSKEPKGFSWTIPFQGWATWKRMYVSLWLVDHLRIYRCCVFVGAWEWFNEGPS